MNAQPDLTDAELIEYTIQMCYRKMCAGKTQEDQLHWWKRMGHWLNQRSTATIMAMEQAKGL